MTVRGADRRSSSAAAVKHRRRALLWAADKVGKLADAYAAEADGAHQEALRRTMAIAAATARGIASAIRLAADR